MTAPRDDLDWDVDRDGRMAQYATGPDQELTTEPHQPLDPGHGLYGDPGDNGAS